MLILYAILDFIAAKTVWFLNGYIGYMYKNVECPVCCVTDDRIECAPVACISSIVYIGTYTTAVEKSDDRVKNDYL